MVSSASSVIQTVSVIMRRDSDDETDLLGSAAFSVVQNDIKGNIAVGQSMGS